jgi:hypothetical protein
VRGTDGLLRIGNANEGGEFVLNSFVESVFRLCDGSRTIDRLAAETGELLCRNVSREEVFAALDFLSDAGLMEARVTPPAKEVHFSRRSLLYRLRPAFSAAVSMGVAVPWARARKADSRESDRKESDHKYNSREGDKKESDRKDNQRRNNQENSDKNDETKRSNESDRKDYQRGEYQGKLEKSPPTGSPASRKQEADLKAQKRDWLDIYGPATWPDIYRVVNHKLSEVRVLARCWARARATPNPVTNIFDTSAMTVTGAYNRLLSIYSNIVASDRATVLYLKQAGFEIPAGGGAPVLTGFSAITAQGETHLSLAPIDNSRFGVDWEPTVDPDNLMVMFAYPDKAYDFLKTRVTP